MRKDQRIITATAFFAITIFLLATLDQCQTTRSGPRASTPSAPAETNTPRPTIAPIKTTVVLHEGSTADLNTFAYSDQDASSCQRPLVLHLRQRGYQRLSPKACLIVYR